MQSIEHVSFLAVSVDMNEGSGTQDVPLHPPLMDYPRADSDKLCAVHPKH